MTVDDRLRGARRGCLCRRDCRLVLTSRAITADTALRLARAFSMEPQLWMNLQNSYDLAMAAREIGKQVAKIEPVIEHAA